MIGIHHKDLENQRERLIDLLVGYRKKKGHDITVVFDGWKTGGAQENHSVTGGVRIIYSRLGEKADAVIKRVISDIRREWIVVTSDRDIANHAWSSASIPVSSMDFLRAIGRDPTYSDKEEYDDSHEYVEPHKKGNPRKLSKKEKAVRRALTKL